MESLAALGWSKKRKELAVGSWELLVAVELQSFSRSVSQSVSPSLRGSHFPSDISYSRDVIISLCHAGLAESHISQGMGDVGHQPII